MKEYIKAPLMSQNEINESDTDWDDLDAVKKFIDKRNYKLVKFIRNSLL